MLSAEDYSLAGSIWAETLHQIRSEQETR